MHLRLPAELNAKPYTALSAIARRMREQGIPSLSSDSVQLLAAWETPKSRASEIRQVLLYGLPSDPSPSGRPCTLDIAGQAGAVFRRVLSGGGRTPDEYWTEAYWPGFGIAVRASGLDSYALTLTVLRLIERMP